MKALRILLLAALAWAGAAQARTNVPIVNHENVVVSTASGRTPTQAQVREAIKAAAAANTWELTEAGPDRMVATLRVRGKHTVSADIRYSPQNFSVVYRNSINMNYVAAEPVGTIHPHYNSWVNSLVEAIRTRVSSL